METAERFESARRAATVVLSGIVGMLIGMPVSGSAGSPLSAALIVVAFGALGTAAGYRRRRSRAFFYLTLVALLGLATILMSSWAAPEA